MLFLVLTSAIMCLVTLAMHIMSLWGYLAPQEITDPLFYGVFILALPSALFTGNFKNATYMSLIANWRAPHNFLYLLLLLYTIVFVIFFGEAGRFSLEMAAQERYFPTSMVCYAVLYGGIAWGSAESA